ncbi:hypothetical protein BR93DRAFT_74977 [Coniochaeta sp. PMI_546]|nr:hypothetical protein BR93DRAFT_74977 [Coniochaeta sp. PMI_546]
MLTWTSSKSSSAKGTTPQPSARTFGARLASWGRSTDKRGSGAGSRQGLDIHPAAPPELLTSLPVVSHG